MYAGFSPAGACGEGSHLLAVGRVPAYVGGHLPPGGRGAAQRDGLVGALHTACPELVAQVHQAVLIFGNHQQT